jgi:putative FmdB family regulatory protein
MPTYEFRCPKGHEFEKFYRSMSAAPLEAPCPVCGKIAERQMSAGAGLVFKGSGFYITDYGKDGKKAATSPETAGAKAAKSSADSGTAKVDSAGTSEKTVAKPASEPKSSGDSKPAAASKSAAKKSSKRKE